MKKRNTISVLLILISLMVSACGESGGENDTTQAPTEITEIKTAEDSAEDVASTTEASVVDDISPEIKLSNDNIVIFENDTINYDDYIEVLDNSFEKITPIIDDSNLDISKAGDYIVLVTAMDSSGNETHESISVSVRKKYEKTEIIEIINDLIDEKYYNFELNDYSDTEAGYYEELIDNVINVNDKNMQIGDNVSVAYPGDNSIYNSMDLRIVITDKNYSCKNINNGTYNFDIVIKGETYAQKEVGSIEHNVDSIIVSSSNGRCKLSKKYGWGNAYYSDMYLSNLFCFCFETEKDIDELKKVFKSDDVNVELCECGKSYKSYSVLPEDIVRCRNVISLYDDIGGYIYNETAD